MQTRSLRKVWQASAPLIIWAAHFALCYGVVATECSPALARQQLSIGFLLWASAFSIGACGWMLWRARSVLEQATNLARLAQAGSAVLALAGIVWTSIPLLLLDGCG